MATKEKEENKIKEYHYRYYLPILLELSAKIW
jgi:hypothetical protein